MMWPSSWTFVRVFVNTILIQFLACSVVKASSPSSSSKYSLRSVCQGSIPDTNSEFETVEIINNRIRPSLLELLKSKYFRYYKIDLFRGCPFWHEEHYCVQKDCSVETIDNEDELPESWKAKALSAVDFSGFGFTTLKQKCKLTDKDFCYLEDENSSDGKYVNLLKNPERFTGYNGESAARIWSSIYEENCFSFLGHEISKGFFAKDFPSDLCVEKRVFYKMISGLHASISTHICDEYFNRTTGEWYANLDCYMQRVGNHPDRLGNIYFLYSVMVQSIKKASKYFESHRICSGSDDETTKAQTHFKSILSSLKDYDPTFNEDNLFNGNEHVSLSLKEEFKERFRNISRIMDCVSCEKCRLWGKIQTTGLGTALKILFSFDEQTKDYRLSKTEIIALFNSFGRLSNSVEAKERFDKMLKEKNSNFFIPKSSSHNPSLTVGTSDKRNQSSHDSVKKEKLGGTDRFGLPTFIQGHLERHIQPCIDKLMKLLMNSGNDHRLTIGMTSVIGFLILYFLLKNITSSSSSSFKKSHPELRKTKLVKEKKATTKTRKMK